MLCCSGERYRAIMALLFIYISALFYIKKNVQTYVNTSLTVKYNLLKCEPVKYNLLQGPVPPGYIYLLDIVQLRSRILKPLDSVTV